MMNFQNSSLKITYSAELANLLPIHNNIVFPMIPFDKIKNKSRNYFNYFFKYFL